MTPSLALRDATVQDIQLELIRRTRFNDFDGEAVCRLLAEYRGHWRAVVLDRPGVPNYNRPGRLLVGGLIKLRDLEDNIGNADTLDILTRTPGRARELAGVIEETMPGAMPQVHADYEETDMAVGMGRQEYGLLTVWWD